MAWNIGANDVANAMGTSVGSRALTIKRAVIIAAFLEFSGAFFAGSHVSETIQSGIVDPNIFQADPMIFALGMIGALFATGLWLQIASFKGLPVSTTHAIVGAVLGFGAVVGGLHAIYWMEIVQIVLSWVVSPVLSGIISYILFSMLQKQIFYSFNPLKKARRLAPFLVFFCFFVITLSVLFDGLKNLHLDLSFPLALFYASLVGLFFSFVSRILIRTLPVKDFESRGYESPHQVIAIRKAEKHLQRLKLSSKGETNEKASSLLKEIKALKREVQGKVHYDDKGSLLAPVEKIFVYLQIISASLVAFAHGANDVANAIGPVAAVINVLNTNVIAHTSIIPYWLLILGGIGIVIGLATWGWRVIETVGKRITELTPTRGFCAEFGAAITILIATKMGLPISTTHALVGAVLGIGFARGLKALNLRTLRDIALSWVITIPACAVMSITIFYILRAFLIK